MSTRPRREPTPSRRLLEARAAAVTTRSNQPISTPTPPRTLSPTSRELAEPTPVPPRPETAVPGSAGTAGGSRPSQSLRLTFNASTWARSPVPSAAAARQPVPQSGRLTTAEARSVALQALRARPATERSQTSRSSQWLFKSQFLEDEDKFNSSSDLDKLNNLISSQIDEGHIRIDTPSIRQWFDSIRNGAATIEEMLGSLLLRLIKDKSNYMNKKAIKAALSPPFRPGDDDNNVILYLDWLGRRYPSYRAEFGEIKGILQAEGWGFLDLRAITDSAWERMEIRGRFVNKLKKNLKVFANEELQPEEASAAATDDLSLLP
ncbi:uncharacterized protein PV07_11351 [Cladophialophora immunda]|uniref:Uncharacterized protein n=1 Tax=Cladophialophora immunda TaxID=569365 RepID=A0A0D2BXS9_9EURO|nr:uncharacterized protein PV07_11351 [Cladophialophora immunda]KIW23125.1 hypothetical protein PV07_11351 [Cladophialophora immunda]